MKGLSDSKQHRGRVDCTRPWTEMESLSDICPRRRAGCHGDGQKLCNSWKRLALACFDLAGGSGAQSMERPPPTTSTQPLMYHQPPRQVELGERQVELGERQLEGGPPQETAGFVECGTQGPGLEFLCKEHQNALAVHLSGDPVICYLDSPSSILDPGRCHHEPCFRLRHDFKRGRPFPFSLSPPSLNITVIG
ncbi:unnamed protein product [Arctogadus glacialis]